MTRGRKITLVAAVALASAVAGTVVVSAHYEHRRDAPNPPWVEEDGTVDLKMLPAWIPIAGPDGEPVLDAEGRTLAVATQAYELHGSPEIPPGMVAADTSIDRSQLSRPSAPSGQVVAEPEPVFDADGRLIPPSEVVHGGIEVFWESAQGESSD